MNYFKSLIIFTISLIVGLSGCMQQDSSEIIQSSGVEQKSSTDPSEDNADETLLEVSLMGSSRAERFLGSYDQIERLALDVVRNYGNKQVVTDLVLTQEGGVWKGTVPKLIVGFDYTITGHAYRPYDNNSDNWTTGYIAEPHSSGNKWLEIFQGQVQHPVVEGTNTLSLRLAPILDDRDLSVPRITRIQRPFQLGVQETANIEVSVDTVGEGADDELSWRFRAVDNQSLPVTDGSRGTFAPDSGVRIQSGGSYSPINSSYTAPDNNSPCFNDGTEQGQCPQKLQIRVSNLQEIGVSSHFTVYVTDNETAETTIDNNPVITSISAERVGPNQLQWTIEVSDDDPFDTLAVHWDYLFGEPRSFTDNTTDNLSQNTGRMQTVMEYYDSDDGMLLVTVCETNEGEGNCQYQNKSSTSVEYMLIPHAFPEIVVCDETGCELPNRLAGTNKNPKEWYGCLDGTYDDELFHLKLSPKNFELIHTIKNSNNGTCSGQSTFEYIWTGSVAQYEPTAFVYPVTTIVDQMGDNLSVYQLRYYTNTYYATPKNQQAADQYNQWKVCGYSAGEWKDNVSLDVSSCWGKPNLESIVYYDNSLNQIRTSSPFTDTNLDGNFPIELMCAYLGDSPNNFLNACKYEDKFLVAGDNNNQFQYISFDNSTLESNSDFNSLEIKNFPDNFSKIINYNNSKLGLLNSGNGIYEYFEDSNSWINFMQGTKIQDLTSNSKNMLVIVDDKSLKCSVDNYTISNNNYINAVDFNNGHFLGVGDNGSFSYSTNCINWTNKSVSENSFKNSDNKNLIGVSLGGHEMNYGVAWTKNKIFQWVSGTDQFYAAELHYVNYESSEILDIKYSNFYQKFFGFIYDNSASDDHKLIAVESSDGYMWSYDTFPKYNEMKLPKINKIGNYSHSQILAISDEEDYIYVSNGNFGVWSRIELPFNPINLHTITYPISNISR